MNLKTLLATGAILFTGALYAQTPDDQVPANEGICDSLINATPGLYGLCNAYCEAQDFDNIDVTDVDAITKEIPKRKILDNYNRKKTGSDPDMPCLLPAPECPCFTYEEAESAFLKIKEFWECYITDTTHPTTTDMRAFGIRDIVGSRRELLLVYTVYSSTAVQGACQFFDFARPDPISSGFITASPYELESCSDHLRSVITTYGSDVCTITP